VSEARSGTPVDLDSLVARAREGDSEAFGALYDAYVDRIYRYLRLRTGDPLEAEDLTEQVFIRAWHAIDRFQQRDRPFVAWLYAIASNAVVDYFRARRREEPLDQALVDPAPAHDPLVASELASRRQVLAKAIRQLPPEQQQIVILRFVEGLSVAEVAAIIGKREGNIRVIQHRALAALRRLLDGVVER
jgi:RNA polymerase sigma-70 factor (ECF subfamily)